MLAKSRCNSIVWLERAQDVLVLRVFPAPSANRVFINCGALAVIEASTEAGVYIIFDSVGHFLYQRSWKKAYNCEQWE